MKIEELKHNHSLTDLLKIALFSILMLAPIGMVATRCGYAILNKNAYLSYSNSVVKGQTNEIDTTSDLIVGNYYSFSRDNDYVDTTNTTTQNININSNMFSIFNNNMNLISFRYNSTDINNFLRVRTIGNIGSQTLYTLQQANEYNYQLNVIQYLGNIEQENNFSITANRVYYNNIYAFSIVPVLEEQYIPNIDTNPLDNVYEYSITKLEQSNLFNWTQNTAIYSGINAMNTQLGINSQAINILLTYWLILTCIYIIIDIVLKLFTYLTHMIGSRKS